MSEFFTVVQLTGVNPVSRIAEIIRVTDRSDYTADGYSYMPFLKETFNFSQTLFDNGTTGEDVKVGVGNIVVSNNDGVLDAYKFHGFDGQLVEIYHLTDQLEVPSEANLGFRGVLYYAQFTWDQTTFYVKNRFEELNIQACAARFAGDNEGPTGFESRADDLKDHPKPMLFGQCLNVPMYCVNTSLELYACNYTKLGERKPVAAIWAVRDKGGEIRYEGDMPTANDLKTAGVSPGYYMSCLAEGMIKLGTPALGDVTADVYEAMGEDASAPRVVERILQDVMEYASGIDYDPLSLQALHEKNMASVGIFIEDQDTVIDACNQVLNSIGGFFVPNYKGVFEFGRVELPNDVVDVPVAVFTDDIHDADSLERVMTGDQGHGIPCKSLEIRHSKNFKVLDKGSVLESVPTELKTFLSQEWRTSAAPNASSSVSITDLAERNSIVHKLAPDLSFDTLLVAPRPLKLRNGGFYTADELDAPTMWDIVDPGDGFITVADGVCTFNGASTSLPEIRQNIGISGNDYTGTSLEDELYNCRITVSFEIVDGYNGLAFYTIIDGVTENYTVFDSNGVKTVTFEFQGDPANGLVIAFVSTSSVVVSQFKTVSVAHAQYGLSADQEAARRFALHAADTERYKVSMPFMYGRDVKLGQIVELISERFQLENGKLFVVIGKEHNQDDEEVVFDLYG